MQVTSSADGTRIAFWREGSGPPVLLVHGGICDHHAWHAVVPLLARRHTVWTYDRRGRGASGDAPPYRVEREVEDITALLDAIGEPAHLLGHSAGAMLALAAALRGPRLLSLILYEPPFAVGGDPADPDPGERAQIEACLAAGDRDQALRLAMRATVATPDAELDRLQAGSGWQHLRALAPSILYDWRIWEEGRIPPRPTTLPVPVLLLLGSETIPRIRVATEALRQALPRARLKILPGQAHFAMVAAPELFAGEVVDFMERADRE